MQVQDEIDEIADTDNSIGRKRRYIIKMFDVPGGSIQKVLDAIPRCSRI